MAEYICPSCGKDLPSEMGQHATNVVSGLVNCPHCGEPVSLREGAVESPSDDYTEAEAARPGRTEGTDEFAGSETIEGLTEELKDKYR